MVELGIAWHNEMKRGGLVISKRGKAGGYLLARAPGSITLQDVVQSLEPNLVEDPAESSGSSGSAVNKVWQGVSDHINQHFQSISLEAIANDAIEPMYFI